MLTVLDDLQAATVDRAPAASRPLPLVDLLHDLDGLTRLLGREVAAGSWLNAFLLAAGACQVVEDWLHDGPVAIPRVERHLRRVLPGVTGLLAARAVHAGGAAAWAVRDARWSEVEALGWRHDVAALVDRLAACAVRPPSDELQATLRHAAEDLERRLDRLPIAVRRSVARLPSCFRNFDQHPDDVECLTREFSRRWPDRSRPIVVVGVRTSGSYTAPLHAAWLRALGYEDVRVLTYRPERGWRQWERTTLRAVLPSGLAIVSDDPPKSGGSVTSAVRALRQAGFSPDCVVPMLQLLDGAELPKDLRAHPHVLLEWPDWSVHARLEPDVVRETLGDMLPDAAVLSVQRLPLPARGTSRRHVEALFSVRLQRRGTTGTEGVEVYVKGVGQGYFGEHSLAVASALAGWVPETFGLRDGLLYRRWLPAAAQLRATGEAVAKSMGDYVAARSRSLAVPDDMSARLVDRGAVWQRAADIVGRSFGRWHQFVRPVSHRAARSLLRVDTPSVVDGNVGLDHWFEAKADGTLLKVDADERAFCSLDLYCYDPAFDLAGLPEEGRLAEAAAIRHGGVDPERWLLYRLVHIAELERDVIRDSVEVERMRAAELQRYLARTVFADARVAAEGRLCVFDLDWTLETRRLGFPSMTPAAAFALRALSRHGYTIALCTGRSLEEVRERCAAYGLAGGVAEYGAAIYDHVSGEVRPLVGPDQSAALDRLRSVLANSAGVVVDPAYRYAVRAFTFDGAGRRRALDDAVISAAISRSGVEGAVRLVQGRIQTDFAPADADKGRGIRALAAGRAIELAVGDSVEDLPYLGLARHAYAPMGSELATAKNAGVKVLRARGPKAVERAVESTLGHEPGGCPTCAANHLSQRSRLVLSLLAAQDTEGLSRLRHAARLWAALRRTGA